jgi:hypothetical protein
LITDDKQPLRSSPITEYVVFAVGLTIALPPSIVYVFAPDGLIVNADPEQIVPLLTVTTGCGLTFTVVIATAVQVPVSPVTE